MGEWGKCRSFVELYLQSFSEKNPSNPIDVKHHKPTTPVQSEKFSIVKVLWRFLNCKNGQRNKKQSHIYSLIFST